VVHGPKVVARRKRTTFHLELSTGLSSGDWPKREVKGRVAWTVFVVFPLSRGGHLGNGENYIMKSLVICTPYPILCGW
jgi:hypothetical protein